MLRVRKLNIPNTNYTHLSTEDYEKFLDDYIVKNNIKTRPTRNVGVSALSRAIGKTKKRDISNKKGFKKASKDLLDQIKSSKDGEAKTKNQILNSEPKENTAKIIRAPFKLLPNNIITIDDSPAPPVTTARKRINSSLVEKSRPFKSFLNKKKMYDHRQPQLATTASSKINFVDDMSSQQYQYNRNANDPSHMQKFSMATLCNIGNTCYLNSVVYTLRFAPSFLHNLHHLVEDLSQINQKLGQNKLKSSSLGRNIGGLSGQSTRSFSTKDLASMGNFTVAPTAYDFPKTNRQTATEKLHELYTSLNRNEVAESSDAYHADSFLSAVQDVSSIFEGNQQQDAHEFLMCILDSIRETCQSLTKVITECPDIIVNGFVSLPEKIIECPPTQSTQTNVRYFFRKRNKDEKSKSKDSSDSIDVKNNLTATTTTTNHLITINDDNDKLHRQQQQQSQEKICDKITEKIKKLGLDFFTEDFEGVTVSSTKCLSCETITEQKETMIDLSVPITGYENMDTIDNPDLFIQNMCITSEQFRGENKYRCENCTGLTEAIRTISYQKLPRLLIIQLKRFSGGMEKINSYIPTPFTMQCFCSQCCEQPPNEKLHYYKLYSVITHVGATLSVGHYIAYTRSLDNYSEYFDCPKDKRKHPQQSNNSSAINLTSTSTTTNTSEKNPSLMKKFIFTRNKASSSGDVTKNMKNINGGGLNAKGLLNGMDKLSLNHSMVSCQSLNCCGIYMKAKTATANNLPTNLNNSQTNGHSNSNNCNNSDYLSNNTDSVSAPMTTTTATTAICLPNKQPHQKPVEPIWHMCDDDKIKTMTQREFEELLSPNNKKIMITPYLLFYARIDARFAADIQ